MKNVVVLSNHPHGLQLQYDQIAEPERFRLHVITSEAGVARMRPSDRASLAGLYVTRDFSLASLTAIIDEKVAPSGALEFVTNNESVVSVCGKLRVYYGIGDKDYECFCNKEVMKACFSGADVRFPEYTVFDKRRYAAAGALYLDELLGMLRLPLFVKPLNGAGSVGTGKLETREDLCQWANTALDTPYEFEVDKFIDGTLFHCETLLKNGKILFTQVCEYSRPCFDFTLGAPLGSITLPNDHPDAIRLKAFALQVHPHLAAGISGVTHLEVFKDRQAELFFVEIAYRTPGVLASEMYQHRLGLSLPECHIRLQVSDDYRIDLQEHAFAARFIYPRTTGVVEGFAKVDVASKHEFQWWIKPGEMLARSCRISEMAGTLLLWNRDFDQLHGDFRALSGVIPYTVHPKGRV